MNSSRHNRSALTARALRRPLAKFGTILVAIFLVELTQMLAAGWLQLDMTGWDGALMDAVTLTALVSVVLWPLIVKPLRDALTNEQAMAHTILESVNDAIITIDDRGIILEQNRASRRMFGVVDQYAIGRNVSMFMPSPHRERHDGYLENYRRTGEAHVIGTTRQLEAVRADGEVFPIELSVSEVWAGGKRYFTACIRDITRRKRTEEHLKKLSSAVEQSPAATVITDINGRFEYVNPKFLEVTGYSQEELIGKDPSLIKSGRTPPAVYEDLWRTILSGQEWRGDMQNRKKNGELYWEREIISAVKDERGAIVNFIAVKEDITARRQAEEALQRKHANLLETERELRKAQESLATAARLEAVGRLAAGVAHEVKNPLTTIRLGVDYLANQRPQENNQQVLQDVREAVDRADYVIKDLLDFARLRELARRPTDVNQVIDNALHLVKHELKLRNVVILRSRDERLPRIFADPNRLVQVFINLFSNAAQAIDKDGSIEVVTRSLCLSGHDLDRAGGGMFRLGEQVITVDIRDNGPGIAVDHEKKLFEPFFTAKPVGEGTGLGLAVSRNIVIMHGGAIDISNRPEGGASAYLMFRVAQENLTDEQANTGSG